VISDVLHKVTSRPSIGIPKEKEDDYDLVILNTGETFQRTRKLEDYNIKSKDTIILRRTGKAMFGRGLQKLNPEDVQMGDKIGQGTFGKVYHGICFGIEVAIKKLKELPDQEQINDITHEIDILSKFQIPQIVTLYGFIEDLKSKSMCLVMEFCSRGSLYHVLSSVVYDFGWDRTFKFAIEFVTGMNFLHLQNPSPIVHRDFKSLNVLVTEDWQIKLCDFGLSRRSSADELNSLKRLRSTPAWSPPELLREVEFTPSSDIYGMGVTIWEMAYRCIYGKYQRPFAEYKDIIFDYQILVQASNGKRPTLPLTLPEQLKELIEKCWDGEPQKRPTCEKILNELQQMQQEYLQNSKRWDQAKI